jgi:hypothetical protein
LNGKDGSACAGWSSLCPMIHAPFAPETVTVAAIVKDERPYLVE